MAGLNANSMLKAVQPQTPNGTAFNASYVLGLGAGGADLQQQLQDDLEQRRKKMTASTANVGSGGFSTAAGELFGGMR